MLRISEFQSVSLRGATCPSWSDYGSSAPVRDGEDLQEGPEYSPGGDKAALGLVGMVIYSWNHQSYCLVSDHSCSHSYSPPFLLFNFFILFLTSFALLQFQG